MDDEVHGEILEDVDILDFCEEGKAMRRRDDDDYKDEMIDTNKFVCEA